MVVKPKPCSVIGCSNIEGSCYYLKHNKIYCPYHKIQLRRYGGVFSPVDFEERKCSVIGCESLKYITHYKKHNKLYCCNHKYQVVKYGGVFSFVFFHNIKIVDNYAIMIIKRINEDEVETKIDIEDINKIKKHRWSYNGNYIISGRGKEQLKLHRYVMNYSGNKEIDHININKLDNRKQNLRIVNRSLNAFNSGLHINNKSGYSGVYQNKTKKWVVNIKINNRTKYLGQFININNAINIRRKAEIKYFGEYSNKNYKAI